MNIMLFSTNGDAAGVPKHIAGIINGSDANFNFILAVLNKGVVSEELKHSTDVYYSKYGNKTIFRVSEYLRFIKIIRKHNIELIHTHSFIASLFSRILAFFTGVRVIYTVHGWPWRGKKKLVAILSYVIEVLLSYLLRVEFIFVCEHTYNTPPKLLRCYKYKVIYNGVELQYPSENLPNSERKLKVGMVARVDASKDHKTVARALEEISIPIELSFVGRGTDAVSFQDLFKNAADDVSFRFYGEVLEPQFIMMQQDLVILISNFEALPLTIIEAFGLKKNVLATKVGGIPELFRYNENFLVPIGEHLILRRKLTEYYNLPEADKRKYAAYNFQNYQRNFTQDLMLKRLSSMYCDER